MNAETQKPGIMLVDPDTTSVSLLADPLAGCAKKFWDKMGLSFKVENILNQEVHFLQGDMTTLRYKPGVSFSLGLSYSN